MSDADEQPTMGYCPECMPEPPDSDRAFVQYCILHPRENLEGADDRKVKVGDPRARDHMAERFGRGLRPTPYY